MAVETKITGLFNIEVLRRGRALSERGFKPELAKIGQFMRDQIRQGFELERDPYGTPWKPLAAYTVQKRREEGVSDLFRVMTVTGELSRSFQYRMLANGVRVWSDHVFDDGTDPGIHQEGGAHPETGRWIPARPMVPDMDNLPQHWEEFIERTIGDGIDRLFN